MNTPRHSIDRGVLIIRADAYTLALPADGMGMSRAPYATLTDAAGATWTRVSLVSSVHRTDARDEVWSIGLPRIDGAGPGDDALTVIVPTASAAWDAHELRLHCTADAVELTVSVRGSGRIGDVVLLGGSGRLPSGAAGEFRSLMEFASVFVPAPGEPVAFVRPARVAAALGVVGDADPGRLNAIFSPSPLALGLGREAPAGPTELPGGDWLGLGLRAPVAELGFTTMRYEPLDDGYWLRLSYEGHTSVDGGWTSPTVVLRPAGTALGVLEDYRADLERCGLAPAACGPSADWWHEPIFCGWGAQCARLVHVLHESGEPLAATAPESGREETTVVKLAPQLARQDVYDEFLARLTEHDLVPGTIVLDDRWQAEYGTATPDLDSWPDLRGWIAGRHAAGQRVLLWWKAWDPEGLPLDECVLDAGGRPVAADPANPRYLARLRGIVTELLSADGLDADGFKVDFTQRAPSGESLRAHDGPWGIAALHALLAELHAAAKAAKHDALVICHTVHPSFGDVLDMVRLNDVSKFDSAGARVPVVDQLTMRHAIATRVLPRHVVDTDQWPMPNRAEWLRYAAAQTGLGVPALYYVEAIDRSGEPIGSEHLRVVADTWRNYRAELARGRERDRAPEHDGVAVGMEAATWA